MRVRVKVRVGVTCASHAPSSLTRSLCLASAAVLADLVSVAASTSATRSASFASGCSVA